MYVSCEKLARVNWLRVCVFMFRVNPFREKDEKYISISKTKGREGLET